MTLHTPCPPESLMLTPHLSAGDRMSVPSHGVPLDKEVQARGRRHYHAVSLPERVVTARLFRCHYARCHY